jgi:hypothetical protein
MMPPVLEVPAAGGGWRTLNADLGFPVGRPQTVLVDLSTVPDDVRQVRISTNMRVYWDQALVGMKDSRVEPRLTRMEATAATLRWRGFSAEVSPDGREPLAGDYRRVSTVLPWKVMPGRYTREGDVRDLLLGIDDQFIVSRTGDEIALSFDASAVPAPPAGWTTTFPVVRRRVQQGDEPQLGQPGSARAAAVSRNDALSVSAVGGARAKRRVPRLPRSLQHPHRHAPDSVDRPRPARRSRRRPPPDESTMSTSSLIRYAAAACQTDLANPATRDGMTANTDRMVSMIDSAVAGSAPFLPVRLVVFPEFAHAAPVYATARELREKLAVPIPNVHTDRLVEKARQVRHLHSERIDAGDRSPMAGRRSSTRPASSARRAS